MTLLVSLSIYICFCLLVVSIIRRAAFAEAVLGAFLLAAGTYGELLNCFVYHAAAYPGIPGFPVYIVLGVVLLGISCLKISLAAERKFKKNSIIFRLAVFLLLSSSFPLIEIAGISAGLWYWIKPCSYTSVQWIIGVWKYYMIFMGIPVMAALCFKKREK